MKKGVITATIVLFLCVAVYLNMNTTEPGSDEERLKEVVGIVGEEVESKDEQISEKDNVSGEKKTEKEQSGDLAEYFEKARIEKQKARDTAITTLKEAVSEENLSQASRDSAAESIETISTSAISESRIETLVKAKGYQDCITLINDAGVNVIVSAPQEGLSASDITKIKDIAVSETGFSPGNIKIIEIK